MELETELVIGAPPEVVWRVLMDFARYSEWNPFIVTLEGSATVGSRLRARIVPPGTRGITMRPTVKAVEAGREFRWKGSLIIPGLFDGEHRFAIEPHEGGCRFIHSERFTGILVPLFRRSLDTETRRGFEAMNLALRTRAESLAGDEGARDSR